MSEHVPGHESHARAEARRERLRERMDRIEGVLARPAGGDLAAWRVNVALACDELDEVLRDHISETEEQFFGELLERTPQLDRRIAQLRDDHPALQSALDDLRASLSSDLPDAEAVAETRERGVALIADLLRHRQVGADLLYEAYWVDVPSAD